MAIYHLSLKTVKRSDGRSAVAAAAYRAGALLHDARTGLAHDYRRKRDVMACGIELPDGANAPWAMERQSLWNAAEAAEKRKDAQTAREFELALPGELTEEQNRELVRSFAGELAQEYGCAADWAIHAAARGGDRRNVHAHILITVREVLPEGPGGKIRLVQEQARLKREGLPLSAEQLRMIRERWAELANRALAAAGLDIRIDHRSHEGREAGIIPTRHVGVHAGAMSRKGAAVERSRLGPGDAERNAARLLSHPEDLLRLVSEGRSVFGESDIRRAAGLAAGRGSRLAEAVLEAAMASPELVRIPSDEGPDAPLRLTTRRTVAMETALAKSALSLRRDMSHGVPAADLEGALAASDRRMAAAGIAGGLSDEQRQALKHVAGPAGIAVVSGAAGAGKSTMLEAARDAWERSGRRVIGAALAGKAVDGLAGSSGIASRTLSAWAHRWEKGQDRLQAGDVLVIDEAGMLGTAQLSSVLREAERRGAKAVLAGDAEQLQAIDAGSPFRALADACGAASISEIRRQRTDWQRRASALFARHETERALRLYEDEGALAWRTGGDEAAAALAAAYAAHVRDSPGESRLALAHRRADVHALNAGIRAGLQAAGLLAEGGAVLECAGGERRFTAGDRIAFLRNDGGVGVRNGSFGTVEAIEGAEVRVRLDGGAQVTFDAAEFRDFDHGYAATVHKSQGATVDRSFVLAGPAMDRHLAYVAMTRHRNAATLYADDAAFEGREGLFRQLSRAGLQPNALDYDGFLGRRGQEGPAVLAPELKEAFLQFGGDAAPSPAPAAPDGRQAARRAALFARELALIDGVDPDAEPKRPEQRSAALSGLSDRLEAQGRRLAPDMAAMRLREVLAQCDAADAGSPERLEEWRQACRAAADAGADINAAGRRGRSAAHILASCAGDAGWLRIGLEAGMDFAAADEDGITPLHIAVLNADPAVTDAALAGADPDVADASGRAPLHWAAWLGREEQALLLLDAGADPALKDGRGRIPFDLAGRAEGRPMAEGPALRGLRRPRLKELRRLEADVAGLRDAGDYRGPPCPDRLESLTVCRDRIDLRRLALDENRDAALTRDAAERSPGAFAWLRRAARLIMLPARLGRSVRAKMEGWAKERGFEFGLPEPRDGWSPPELRPPPDKDIMAARRAVERRRQTVLARQGQEAALQEKTDGLQERKRLAEEELARLSRFGRRRRRQLEDEIRSAREGLQMLRFELKTLPAPDPEPDAETRRLQAMRTSAERRQDAEARRRDALLKTAERMEADGLFLPRRRDPAHARRRDHPPERSLLFVAASPAHVPEEGSLLRRWHHIAVWDPSSGPEGLKALRELHPDAAMAPAPELREAWPKDVPALDPDKAGHEFWNWGLAGHIDAVEGREPEPAEESGPEPEEPRNGGPSFDPF